MSKPKSPATDKVPEKREAWPSQSLLTDLHSALEAVAESYQRFITEPAPTDAKGFAAHHSAAKAALAHLEYLMKLTAKGHADNPAPEDDRDTLVKEARMALRQTS